MADPTRSKRALAWAAPVIVAIATVAASTIAPARAAAEPCVDVFDTAFRQSIAAQFPTQRVTAAVYDTRTGCWHHLNPGMRIETASVIKAQFLAGALLRAQDAGRGLTGSEQALIAPMMAFSFNPPASTLFSSLGGVSGMNQIDRRFGLTSTTHTSKWGATVTTAQDRTRLALAMLHSGGPLNEANRSLARLYMSYVHGSQQWGITAGVPEGWSVALKNGFFPTTGLPAWRIGSTGFVSDDLSGEGYAVTIMSDRNSNHVTGQQLVETVSRRIATVLTSGDSGARLVDRSRCVTASSGESWSSVAARIGTSDVGGTQTASGGTPNPIGGMRACAPDFRAPPGPNPLSTIGGVSIPLTGDFNGDSRSDIFWYRPGPSVDELWTGNEDATFTSAAINVSGTYQPLLGDFDGDSTTDILWYRPGTGSDHLWSGSTGGGFTSSAIGVSGSYQPILGDFDGNTATDVFWYRPGGASDYVWSGQVGGGFVSTNRNVSGTYEPFTGDFNADTTTDIFWYRPGSAPDYIWPGMLGGGFGNVNRNVTGDYATTVADLNGDGRDDIIWNGLGTDSSWTANSDTVPGFFARGETVPGHQRPVVGDLDGDAQVEVLFYGPGSETDLLFNGSERTLRPVLGRYEPIAGDFNGDSRGDIVFYGRGNATDSMWLGTTNANTPQPVQPRTT